MKFIHFIAKHKILPSSPVKIFFYSLLAIVCPEGSQYTDCGTACPVTCLDPYAVVKCTMPCVETCQCNEGLVLKGEVCVPPTECGCVISNGSYISVSLLLLSPPLSLISPTSFS